MTDAAPNPVDFGCPPEDPPPHPNTIDSNGVGFIAHLDGKARWLADAGRWLIWDGIRWADHKENDTALDGVAALFLKNLPTDTPEECKWKARCLADCRSRNSLLDWIKPFVADSLSRYDQDIALLGVPNGTIDLKTGALLPPDRARLLTKIAACPYDPDAPAPRWNRFLQEIMQNDPAMILYLQRLAGYLLTGEVKEHLLPVFYGEGGNGKSKFLETLMGILGPHASTAPPGLVVERRNESHPTELADLHGKRLVMASETRRGGVLRMDLIKNLTGDGTVKGRFMRQDFFEFKRTHKIVLVTNHKPVLTETGPAITRRLRLVPFNAQFTGDTEDKDLETKLKAEWPGILAWAVRGAVAWYASNDMAEPDAVRATTSGWMAESDKVGLFLTDHYVFEPRSACPRAEVYAKYTHWSATQGTTPFGQAEFNRRVASRGYTMLDKRINGVVTCAWGGMMARSQSHPVPAPPPAVEDPA